MGFQPLVWFGFDWYWLSIGPREILTYFDTYNGSVGLNISLLILQKMRNILDFWGFLTLIYYILETCFGYQNRSEFIQDHYFPKTNPNQTQTEAGTPFFQPENSLKVKYLQFPSAQDFRLYSSWIYGQNALGICWKSRWTIQ